MPTPDNDKKAEIIASKIYKTNDVNNPIQRIIFGVEKDSVGNLTPIIDKRNANTGKLVERYYPNGFCVSDTEPTDENIMIWIKP